MCVLFRLKSQDCVLSWDCVDCCDAARGPGASPLASRKSVPLARVRGLSVEISESLSRFLSYIVYLILHQMFYYYIITSTLQ